MKLSSITAAVFAVLLFTQFGCVPATPNPVWYQDSDGDGYGNPIANINSGSQPEGYVANANDCNDGNPDINPSAEEILDDLDNNCDGQVDEGVIPSTWYNDSDDDGYGDSANTESAIEQPAGYVADDSDCDDTDTAINPAATEEYDGVDNNCDGQVDEGFTATTWYYDSDSDGYGDVNTTTQDVTAPAGYVANSTDCDDTNGAVSPAATEEYDNIDNNCDGEVDEGFNPVTWYFDGDSDGFGDSSSTTEDITQPIGYVANSTDCNDSDGSVNPDAAEEYDSVDNNCNGEIDEGFFPSSWYRDADSDGYGDTNITTSAVLQPAGYVDNEGDCNDSDVAIHPGATEVSDSVDNNCDGQIDEGFDTYYRDSDGDNFGDSSDSQTALSQPAGYVSDATDCDDTSADTYPGAPELADGLDNDCDGDVDEGYTAYYLDSDSDGYGDAGNSTNELSQPAGYVTDNTDCNDASADIYPGAPELADGLDNDCDGDVDEGYTTYYLDSDSDSYGNAGSSLTELSQPAGYVTDNSDCNDSNSGIHPGASEANDDLDNDCDGVIDEGLTPRPPTGLTKVGSDCCNTYGDFQWNPVPNVQAYEIHMDAYFGGGCLIDASAVIENNSGSGRVQSGSLCLGSKYNVKIRSRRDGVWGAWTATTRITL